jgi:replication-associated recombination protein RarA
MSEPRKDNGRFSPGQTGNPKGRPRKDRSVGTAILDALNEEVTANENGQSRKITKMRATAKQLVNKGASGDLRATKMALDLAAKAEAERADAAPVAVMLTETDREIVARFIARIRATPIEE